MILLLDIGNTHTHVALSNGRTVGRQHTFTTASWFDHSASERLRRLAGKRAVTGVVVCSVVPRAVPKVRAAARHFWRLPVIELTHRTVTGIGIDYPKPATIGPDRLANAVAVKHHFGAPAVVVDFGTAVTFDVVDRRGSYIGGIIAPGLNAMTDYLHEKTALLPRIRIRETRAVVGRSTEQAMRIGAVHGYRGLIRGLVAELKRELRAKRLPVVATGGCAELITDDLPEITAVRPLLTLEGLRLVWEAGQRVG